MRTITPQEHKILDSALRDFAAYEAMKLMPPPASNLPPGVPVVQFFKPEAHVPDHESRAVMELTLAGAKFANELLAINLPDLI